MITLICPSWLKLPSSWYVRFGFNPHVTQSPRFPFWSFLNLDLSQLKQFSIGSFLNRIFFQIRGRHHQLDDSLVGQLTTWDPMHGWKRRSLASLQIHSYSIWNHSPDQLALWLAGSTLTHNRLANFVSSASSLLDLRPHWHVWFGSSQDLSWQEAMKHCLSLWKTSRHNCRSLLIILVSEPI